MSSNKKETRIKILETTWHLLEEQNGQAVSMAQIAKKAGISRQAVYLHFESRIELIIATVKYVDEVKGLDKRLEALSLAKNGTELLTACVEIWGNYIPEIYAISKALLNTKDTDPAAATAWSGCMSCLFEVCENVIATLKKENSLSTHWETLNAPEMLMTLISIYNWEQLTLEYGWSQKQYIKEMVTLAKTTFLKTTK